MAEEQKSIARTAVAESSYQRGARFLQEGRFEEAALALAESLREQETSEVWNDWAAAELAAGQSKAERGFRRALALDADNTEAIANLGAFLAITGRYAEAILYLERAMHGIGEQQRAALQQLLHSCRSRTSDSHRLSQSQEVFWKQLADVQEQFPSSLGRIAARPPFDGSDGAVGALKKEVSAIAWYHQIDLGHGVVTKGCCPSGEILRSLQLPPRLDGLTVLDIGAWDGFFSFEAERRGAKRVLATDGFIWRGRCPRASKYGFDLARWALNSRVEGTAIDAMDIAPEKTGAFDIVLLEALYPLRQPLDALDHAFSVTKQLLILRAHVDLVSMDRPAAAFYPHVEFARGASDWWSPNPGAVVEMLRAVGFRRVTVVAIDPANGADSTDSRARGRAVFHAER